MVQNTSFAVMMQRASPKEGADFFPTPPWATRALCERILGARAMIAWDCAAGAGHMTRPLREYFARVYASDLHDYGGSVDPGIVPGIDFMKVERDGSLLNDRDVDWVITNPPFNLAERFALHALALKPAEGVALLVRLTFLETVGRHKRLFEPYPPSTIYQFTERVPMARGKLERTASTATAYCWVVWNRHVRDRIGEPTEFEWIPPWRARLERDEDYE